VTGLIAFNCFETRVFSGIPVEIRQGKRRRNIVRFSESGTCLKARRAILTLPSAVRATFVNQTYDNRRREFFLLVPEPESAAHRS